MQKKKHKKTENAKNLEDTVEMSKKEFIASRSEEIQLRRKVSMKIERESSSTLMQVDTPSSELQTKSLKKTAPTTIHTVMDGHKVDITIYRPAPTPIVSLNTERKKVSIFYAKQT